MIFPTLSWRLPNSGWLPLKLFLNLSASLTSSFLWRISGFPILCPSRPLKLPIISQPVLERFIISRILHAVSGIYGSSATAMLLTRYAINETVACACSGSVLIFSHGVISWKNLLPRFPIARISLKLSRIFTDSIASVTFIKSFLQSLTNFKWSSERDTSFISPSKFFLRYTRARFTILPILSINSEFTFSIKSFHSKTESFLSGRFARR